MNLSAETLRDHLRYEPQELRFGTSGRRGEVIHLTQLEIYLNVTAELEYLQSLPLEDGGIVPGDPFYLACDLRPSSTRFVPEQGGRGEIAQAALHAVRDAGMQPVYLGQIPTPALTAYAVARRKGSLMVTGSHIPFDRNGYKTNSAKGELLKKDEEPINRQVQTVRARLYAQPFANSLFDADGRFKTGSQDLPPANDAARTAYLQRYTDFFANESLKGRRLLVYQHSAVGRDLLVEILTQFGAEVIPAGRSETFVPIDTEAIGADQITTIQTLADAARAQVGPLDAVVSADGDTDRPLILGVEPETGQVRFFGGDLVGMITAEFLGADSVVVPISCNDAIDRGPLAPLLEPKTKIGSPYVIAGMERAQQKGRKSVCGWEANGGFLVGSAIERHGHTLTALPTRDAFLPILCVLFAAASRGLTLPELFATLPARYSRASLLRPFLRERGQHIVAHFSPSDPNVQDLVFDTQHPIPDLWLPLTRIFGPDAGFDALTRLNFTDGLRMYFADGDVAHIRPSGNADELRLYAIADTPERADAILQYGLAEPEGLLRQLERVVTASDVAAET